MRAAFCRSLVERAQHGELVFLTGDLGFAALEPLRDALAARFINAGVAEQNMVSVAAGLARQGFRPWVYSIAPFLYARPFEHIRNDVCFHRLPVVLVGNGGGYGYGVMGLTHHALEDYGTLLTLPAMRVHVPAFDADLPAAIDQLLSTSGPAYLRLRYSEEPQGWPTPRYAAWRKLVSGPGGTIVAVGPLAGAFWQSCREQPEARRPNLWCLSTLPLSELPGELLRDIVAGEVLCVAEEHVAQGGAASMLAAALLQSGCVPRRFVSHVARGYPSGRYGSQAFHRRECGLDAASVLASAAGGAAPP